MSRKSGRMRGTFGMVVSRGAERTIVTPVSIGTTHGKNNANLVIRQDVTYCWVGI